MNDKFLRSDIVIVGAGLVGLAAAVALQYAGFSVVLVDSKDSTRSESYNEGWDARIYAISPRNMEWLNSLGVWPLMHANRIGKMQGMEIFGEITQSPLILDSSDVNTGSLGFIVESKALIRALLKRVEQLGIKTRFGCSCEMVKSSQCQAILNLSNQEQLECQLLLAADGSQSWVRQQMNIPIQKKVYEQVAIVANLKIEKPHGNIARQWFSIEGEVENSILAWLPLPDNMISIVWSVSIKQADMLLKLDLDDFATQVELAGDSKLGKLEITGTIATYSLNLQKTCQLVKGNIVLIGDAAHQVHPMAGQGVNLGFRDIIDLIDILKTKNQFQAINDKNLLKKFTRDRKVDILKMVILTDGLNQLFKNRSKVIKNIRNWGFSKVKHQAVKKMLVANAIAL